MPFNSFSFATFLVAVVAATVVTPRRLRWVVLLLASYVFYGSFRIPYLLAVLLLVTTVSYACALRMGAPATGARGKRRLLWLGITTNVLALVVLKYTGFLAANLAAVLRFAGVPVTLLGSNPFASLGASFFVFQGISYLVDVYLETTPPERHFGLFALHMAFFAKLTQGPIERAAHLLPQLHAPLRLTTSNAAAGLDLMFFGLFKKVVVADRLGALVGPVYSDVHAHTGLPLVLATYLFAFQLYYDFSGYTDIARGTARLFGLDLVENFNAPYLATSVAEFWRRWHMSFTSWVLEYIFKPLQMGFRRWRTWGTPVSLLITFLISGLWHGASWGFVVWGGLHGTFMGASVLSAKWRRDLVFHLGASRAPWLRIVRILVTFHLVCFTWVFFRAESLADALYVVKAAAMGLPATAASVLRGKDLTSLLWLGRSGGEFVLAISLILFTAGVAAFRHGTSDASEVEGRALRRSLWIRTAVTAVAFYLLVFHGASAQSFIYVQF